jgi:acetylornithine deacetylase/succinyl-diaminopimelate desuccinylase-like protein
MWFKMPIFSGQRENIKTVREQQIMKLGKLLIKKPLLVVSLLLGLMAHSTAAEDKSYKTDAVELLRELVSYRTAKGHGQVPVMAKLLEQRFINAGFPESDVHLIPKEPDLASLIVRYKGDGTGGRPILLMAHMDVVDALPSDWENDPFTMIEKEGRFYGRGVSDNKAGIATLTNTFIRLKKEGFVPTRDLVIAFSGDEETDMTTIQQMTTEYIHLTDAEFALNADAGGGELDENDKPVSFNFQAAEKSYMTFEFTARNPGGHSSAPRKDNAIYDLMAALENLENHRFPVKSTEITRNYFKEVANSRTGKVAQAMKRFSENPNDVEAADILSEHPHLVGIVRTTCIATMLKAGHAENALPQTATATVNCRVFPGVSVEQMHAKLSDVVGNNAIEIKVLGNPKASPDSPVLPAVYETIKSAIHSYYPGIPVVASMAAYATDGIHTRVAGIPTYGVSGVFYDSGGGFEHGLNERIRKDSYLIFQDYWYEVLNRFAGK